MTEIRKQFHDELEDLIQEVVRLGQVTVDAIDKGAVAFVNADLDGAEEVIENDSVIDSLMHSIEDKAFDLIARQQPMAVDLRTLITIMREVREIERAGDNIVNVVKATRRMHSHPIDDEPRSIILQMRDQAIVQLNTAVEAFAAGDIPKAAALEDMDDVMDDLQKELFRWLFEHKNADEDIQSVVQLALVGRYFERIADHAVNLAERVPFMVTGSY